MTPDATAERTIDGIDLRSTLRFPTLLTGDPCSRLGAASFERATWTPEGAASIRVRWTQKPEAVASADAWGDGAAWLIERLDGLLGLDDDLTGFAPDTSALRAVWEQNTGLRVCRTGTVWHDVAWLILQQRVRFEDAASAWRAMTYDLGEPAPGPLDLKLPAPAERIAALPYDAFHRFGIERSRAENLIRAAREMPRVVPRVDSPFEEVAPRLQAIRGIGPWTLAGLESMTWGSSDAVIVGDVGIPGLVCWFLGRERNGDDARMLELLEPYRPHRYRILQLAFASGARVPRRSSNPYGFNDIRRK
ncbi:MAG: DNA-3-methyladenine glycosylase 2 family protein [Actinomycetota bacterium]